MRPQWGRRFSPDCLPQGRVEEEFAQNREKRATELRQYIAETSHSYLLDDVKVSFKSQSFLLRFAY